MKILSKKWDGKRTMECVACYCGEVRDINYKDFKKQGFKCRRCGVKNNFTTPVTYEQILLYESTKILNDLKYLEELISAFKVNYKFLGEGSV